MNMFGLSSSVHFAHITCYWKFFLLHYTSPLSVQASQNRSCLSYISYATTVASFPSIRINLSPFSELSKSKSKLLYNWRFTANQFVFASGPLRPTTRVLQLNSPKSKSKSKSKSKLLYYWQFTANQIFLASSPFRPTTRDPFYPQLNWAIFTYG
jgi:hypothetical protein